MQHFPFDESALATRLHVAPLLVCDVDCLVVDSSDVGLSTQKVERNTEMVLNVFPAPSTLLMLESSSLTKLRRALGCIMLPLHNASLAFVPCLLQTSAQM